MRTCIRMASSWFEISSARGMTRGNIMPMEPNADPVANDMTKHSSWTSMGMIHAGRDWPRALAK